MATISKNFTGASLLRGTTTVTINATSNEGTPPVEAKEPATTKIYVFIVDLPNGHPPLMARAPSGGLDSQWTVEFKNAVPPLDADDIVHVIGVAIDSADSTRNFGWDGHVTILNR